MGNNKINSIKKSLKVKYSDRFLLRLVSSYSLILIIILVLGLFTYNVGINSARDNLIEENSNILENAVTEVDKSFQIMLSLNYQIANSADIAKFVEAKEAEINSSFFLNLLKAKNNLTNLLSVQNLTFVDNTFIYAHNTDYILSANEVENSSLYYHFNRRYNEEHYEEFMDRITNPIYSGKPQNLDSYSNTRNDFLLYTYQMSMYRIGSRYPATICYAINRNYFEDIFADLNLYDIGFILIVDNDNQELMKISTRKSTNIANEDIIGIQIKDGNSEMITKNGEKLVVSSVISKNNQWTYYLVQPSAMVFYNLSYYQNIYMFIIMIALLVGVILLFVLSHNNLAPFKKIENQLEDCFTEEDDISDFKGNDVRNSIDHYIKALIDKKATMQQMLEWQQPFIYSASLSKLMNGLLTSDDELEKIAKNLNIKAKESNFSVLYVNVCLNELDFYIDDSVKIKRGYQEVIKEVFYNYFGESIYIYEVDSRSFSILMQWDKESLEFNEQIKILFRKVYEELRGQYTLTIYGGVSDIFTDLMLTWQAYQHAFEAFNFAGPNNELQEYNHIVRNVNNYYFPLELEQQLVNFIMNGKQNQVEVIMKNIYLENFIERALPISMIKCLLSDLRNTLLKVKFMLPANDNNKDKLKDLEYKLGQKKSYELMQSIANDLCEMFETKSTQNVLIDKIQQYIRENYMDSSLSLCKISEEFNISESYFSYLFKEVTKENFSEYLEKIRIDKAYQLLKTTSMNIVDIAKDVGYNNPASFRRAFKRICKITPVEVRSVSHTNNQQASNQET
jgi:AraC-like DNA-binding protein